MGRYKIRVIFAGLTLVLGCGGYRHTSGQITISDKNQSGQVPIQAQCTGNLKTQLEANPASLFTGTNDVASNNADQLKQRLSGMQPQGFVYSYDQDSTKKISKLELKAVYDQNQTESVALSITEDPTSKLLKVRSTYNNNDQNNPGILTQDFSVDQNCNPTLTQSMNFSAKTTDQINYSISASTHTAAATQDPAPTTPQVQLTAGGKVMVDRLETLDPTTLRNLVTTLGGQNPQQHVYLLGAPGSDNSSFAREILIKQGQPVSHNDINGNSSSLQSAAVIYQDPKTKAQSTGPIILYTQDGTFAVIQHQDSAKTETSIVTKDIFDQKLVTEPKPSKTKAKGKAPLTRGNVTTTVNPAETTASNPEE